MIDGFAIEGRAWAYSTADRLEDVPSTVGFASAVYGWTDDLGSGGGIAVFGGALRDGTKSNALWLGRFGGVDRQGTPFFAWQDATPTSGQLPPPRSGASIFYDEPRDLLVLVGGELANGALAEDVWTFDPRSGEWAVADRTFMGLKDFASAQFRDTVYIAGGEDGSGGTNPVLYKLSLADLSTTRVTTVEGGPGSRARLAVALDPTRRGRVILYGGIDSSGVGHNDVWEYDLETDGWTSLKEDSIAAGSPEPGKRSFVVVSPGASRLSVFGGIDEAGNRSFSLDPETDEWHGNMAAIEDREPVEMDCDGDGRVETETTLACKSDDAWYAEVGTLQCADREGSGAMVCDAAEPSPMAPAATWSPDGWEWIVDYAEGPGAYTYVLTDSGVLTFDTLDTANGLYPVDADELTVPGSCWWCGGTDWGFSIEVVEGYLFAGTASGLHVFDIQEPWAPAEIGYFASFAPVVDLVELKGLIYLAEGNGVTALSLEDPTAPRELDHVPVGWLVTQLEKNETARKLMALTPGGLKRLDVGATPASPKLSAGVSFAGWAMWEMRTEGKWTYLNGPWTETVHDGGEAGLTREGAHDLRAWVDGRILRGSRAQRVRLLNNDLQVWEVSP